MTFLHFKEILCPIKTQQGFFKYEENLLIFQSNFGVNNRTEARVILFSENRWRAFVNLSYKNALFPADIKK
jgi:hypothetical protein